MKYLILFTCSILLTSASTCSGENHDRLTASQISQKQTKGLHKAYFASGCFWCVEAIFESVRGVGEVISGYSGGDEQNPTYERVGGGLTAHAEAVEVYYDTTVVDYPTLLKVFFGSHDPTTLNRQGPDVGPQYRSAIFYQNQMEKQQIDQYIVSLQSSEAFDGDITTEVSPLRQFWVAEDYHQDYEAKNPHNPYVRAVSIPRLKKFQHKHPNLLKEGGH